MIATTPEDCEYYTPPELLEKVYQVMPITLDPASPPPSPPSGRKSTTPKNKTASCNPGKATYSLTHHTEEPHTYG